MKQQEAHCPKCGAILLDALFATLHDGEAALEPTCPYCRHRVDLADRACPGSLTSADLEEQLFSLVELALASDMPPDAIGLALCDVLTSLAEHNRPDHRFSIAFLDLGVTDEALNPVSFPDRTDLLRQRYAHGKRARGKVRH